MSYLIQFPCCIFRARTHTHTLTHSIAQWQPFITIIKLCSSWHLILSVRRPFSCLLLENIIIMGERQKEETQKRERESNCFVCSNNGAFWGGDNSLIMGLRLPSSFSAVVGGKRRRKFMGWTRKKKKEEKKRVFMCFTESIFFLLFSFFSSLEDEKRKKDLRPPRLLAVVHRAQ